MTTTNQKLIIDEFGGRCDTCGLERETNSGKCDNCFEVEDRLDKYLGSAGGRRHIRRRLREISAKSKGMSA